MFIKENPDKKTYFTSCVSIVNFEQVNAGWDGSFREIADLRGVSSYR